ncbi:MAG: ribokinase [Lachnospiraceae bacterium]|jgi:ribokinase|nr:ribokinase [Lachnospiraceae bacterium]
MRVLNFGSLNIDYFYKVDHFVQKGETQASDMLNVYAGGKGLNQSVALSRAGAEVYHAGMIGVDGTFLKEMLKDAGVNTEYVEKSQNIRTGHAIIQNDSMGDNCIILYGGANQAITREIADNVMKNFNSGDWLILQNEISEIPYIAEKAAEKGMKIFLNPSPMNDKIFEINLDCIDCFILNEGEGKALAGLQQSDGDALIKQLREQFPHAEIVLTLGENGSVYAGKDGIVWQDAYRADAVDTTAAGDTFTGYFMAGRLHGMPVKEALTMASKASALAVSKKGAALSIPTRKEVLEFEVK